MPRQVKQGVLVVAVAVGDRPSSPIPRCWVLQWLHCCALISHTLNFRDTGSCQSSSLFLWPLAVCLSLCR